MLLRSSRKKQGGSPKEEAASDANEAEHVNVVQSNKSRPENKPDDVVQLLLKSSNSNNSMNCQSCSSDRSQEYSTLTINCNITRTLGKAVNKITTEKIIMESSFSSGLTNSTKKGSGNTRSGNSIKLKMNLKSDESSPLLDNVTNVNERELSDGMVMNRGYSYFKGVLVNEEISLNDFKKEPVVEIIPLTEEEVKKWNRSGRSPSYTAETQEENSSSSSHLNGSTIKRIEDCILKKDLRCMDYSLEKQRFINDDLLRKGGSRGSRKCLHKLYNEENKTFHLLSSDDDNVGSEMHGAKGTVDKNDFIVVFGDLTSKNLKLFEKENGFREGRLYSTKSEDSIATEIYEKNTWSTEDEESDAPILPIENISDVAGEIFDSRYSLEKIKICDKERETGNDKNNENCTSMNDGNIREEGTNGINENLDGNLSQEESKTEESSDIGMGGNVSFRNDVLIGSKYKRKRESKLIDKDTWIEDLQHVDGPEATQSELLAIQIACIKKELQSRRADSAKKRLRLAGSSETDEKITENEETDFASARKTRRSKRLEDLMDQTPMAKARRTPTRRSSVRKQSLEDLENRPEDNVTPKSTRIKSSKTPGTIERRRRTSENTISTPKRGRTPKNVSQVIGEISDIEKEHIESPLTRSRRSRISKAPRQLDEIKESVDAESTATPKSRSLVKKSQIETPIEKEDNEDDSEPEMVSPSKLRKSEPPGRSRVGEEEEEKMEFDEKTILSLSSPLKKKKEAAERLRAEEKRLSEKQFKEGEDVATSPKKSVSPATSASLPSKKTTPLAKSPSVIPEKTSSPVKVPLEIASPVRTSSTSPEKTTKINASSPIKIVSPEVLLESPMKAETQKSSSPKKITSPVKSPFTPKRCSVVLQPIIVEKELPNTETSASSPAKEASKTENLTKSQAEPQIIEEDAEVLSSPKQKNKTPKKRNSGETKLVEEEEKTSLIPCSEVDKNETLMKQNTEQKEEEIHKIDLTPANDCQEVMSEAQEEKQDKDADMEFEEHMCGTSPKKQKKTRSIRKKDVEVFSIDDSNSDDIEELSMKSSPKKRVEEQDSVEIVQESEVADLCSVPSTGIKKSKNVWKIREVTSDEEEERVANDVENSALSSRKKKKKKKTIAEKGEDKPNDEESTTNENVYSDPNAETQETNKRRKKEKRKKVLEHEITIPKLADDFLESVPSKKIDVKVKGRAESNDTSSKKRKKLERQEKPSKIFATGEDYIPLDVSGPTKFSVVGLDKLKSANPRHAAYDLKHDLLYGSRIARVPYSCIQSYKLKSEIRKMKFSPK